FKSAVEHTLNICSGETREFRGVRREECPTVAKRFTKRINVAVENVESIRIENYGTPKAREYAIDEGSRFRGAAKSGSDDDAVGPRNDFPFHGRVVHWPATRQGKRFGRLYDAQAVGGDNESYHADAAAHRGARGENRRASHPARDADDRQLLASALVGI